MTGATAHQVGRKIDTEIRSADNRRHNAARGTIAVVDRTAPALVEQAGPSGAHRGAARLKRGSR
jgi:hypothetical protein